MTTAIVEMITVPARNARNRRWERLGSSSRRLLLMMLPARKAVRTATLSSVTTVSPPRIQPDSVARQKTHRTRRS